MNSHIYRRFRKPAIVLLFLFMLTLASQGVRAAETVPVIPTGEDTVVRFAARELAGLLDSVYADAEFPVKSEEPGSGRAIFLGTPQTSPLIREMVDQEELSQKDAFVVRTGEVSGHQVGVIAGESPRAVLYSVYELLEELGCGFYLSYNAMPGEKAGSFSFEKWDFSDQPLTGDRIVFDWHNFLSSCSTWDLPHWRKWIAQAARMRYSGVMVHAYGNNPMFQFSHNGKTKPVGYLATTARGRDWGTQHVNDVRRLHGGQVFKDPVFGSEASKVEPEKRVEATRKLMRKAFDAARRRGLDVHFALDVDTRSSNPAEVIRTLPESARFESAGRPLANPDTPEGYAYYRSMIHALLESYPQITDLVVWHRRRSTLWRRLKVEDFPEAWKPIYKTALAEHPEVSDHPDSPSMFAISRIARAFRRILDEMGRDDVELNTGTWGFSHLPAANAFMPDGVALMALDWSTIFDTPQREKEIKAVSGDRKMIPIVWAHHDDRTYMGRSYTPYEDFAATLNDYGAAGFGIIHWITRPLDLYFKSHGQQVWKRFANQPLSRTCRRMAERTFGGQAKGPMARYLADWVRTAPQFGRETSDRFMDRPVSNVEQILEGCERRLSLLDKVDIETLPAGGRCHYRYYRLSESFYKEFFRSEFNRQQALQRWQSADLEGARELLQKCDPEAAIQTAAEAFSQCGITRGEQALIISLNLRWLPYFESNRQMLGMAPVRINYQPTRHEPLAQGAGHHTFFVDAECNLWGGLGERETGVPVRGEVPRGIKETEPQAEIARTWLVSENPIKLSLKTLMGQSLAPGEYRVELLFPARSKEAGTLPEAMDVALQGKSGAEDVTARVDLSNAEREGKKCVRVSRSLRVEQGGIDARVTGVGGPAVLAGAVIHPVEVDEPEPVKRQRTEDELQIKAATASESVSFQYGPVKSVDLDRQTRWAAEGDGQWIQYDLGKKHLVTDLSIAWYQGQARHYRFEVAVSDTGEDWKTIFEGQSSASTSALEKVKIPETRARYLRIICHGNDKNDWNSIHDVLIETE